MPHFNLMEKYLDKVCSQIRWKRAHPIVRRELGDHISDQQVAFIKTGMEEEKALNMAIREMGEPVHIGTLLDRSYRPKPAWPIIIITLVTMILGFFLRFYLLLDTYGYETAQLTEELIILCIAVAVMITGYFIDYSILSLKPIGIYIMYNLGIVVLGIISGINIYSPYLLILFPIVFSGVMYSQKITDFYGLSKCTVLQLLPVLLYVLTGQIPVAIMSAVVGMYMIAQTVDKDAILKKKVLWHVVVITSNLIILAIAVIADHRTIEMYKGILNAKTDTAGYGYISNQIINILNCSKLVGTSNYSFPDTLIPSISSNYIVTYLIYKFGWVSFIITMMLLFTYFSLIYIRSIKQKSKLGQLLSKSVVMLLVMQALIYVLANVRLGMIFTMPLPLISYGKVSMILHAFIIGLVLSAFRQDSLSLKKKSLNSIII